MKLKEIKNKMQDMTVLELEQKLNDSKEELFNLRFQLATSHGQAVDYSKIKQVRKQIARIKTILREKELSIRN
ncbi:MAG: 50S ribosomal protein L29 [Armatimonadetes bacterium]|nr:50S ribosomal protein L29 [Armatimonadota bacterium]